MALSSSTGQADKVLFNKMYGYLYVVLRTPLDDEVGEPTTRSLVSSFKTFSFDCHPEEPPESFQYEWIATKDPGIQKFGSQNLGPYEKKER